MLTLYLFWGPLPYFVALIFRALYFFRILMFLLTLITIVVYRQLIIFKVRKYKNKNTFNEEIYLVFQETRVFLILTRQSMIGFVCQSKLKELIEKAEKVGLSKKN